jgi:hypothetical protein
MSRHVKIRSRLDARSVALGALVLASTLALAGRPARAEEAAGAGAGTAKPKQARACQVAYQSGQDKENAGQMVEAQKLYLSCSDPSCAAATWHACVSANTHLRATLPTVVPVVVDASGTPRADVEVKMDGQVILSQLNGVAIPVDPGTHEFSFSVGSDVFASTKIDVVAGERNRTISVSCPAAVKPRRPATAQK